MYIRQADMHPELRAILEERDPALGPQAAGMNYIFELERLRGCWRVVDLLRAHGVEAIILDCDGNIDELLPMSISSTLSTRCAS